MEQQRATVRSRGRVTIPAEVRDALGLQPGDEIAFVEVAPGHVELQAVEREDRSSRSRAAPGQLDLGLS